MQKSYVFDVAKRSNIVGQTCEISFQAIFDRLGTSQDFVLLAKCPWQFFYFKTFYDCNKQKKFEEQCFDVAKRSNIVGQTCETSFQAMFDRLATSQDFVLLAKCVWHIFFKFQNILWL